jgi:hypothetical protein
VLVLGGIVRASRMWAMSRDHINPAGRPRLQACDRGRALREAAATGTDAAIGRPWLSGGDKLIFRPHLKFQVIDFIS